MRHHLETFLARALTLFALAAPWAIAQTPETAVLNDGRSGGIGGAHVYFVQPNYGTGPLTALAAPGPEPAEIPAPAGNRAVLQRQATGEHPVLVGTSSWIRVHTLEYPARATARVVADGSICTAWFYGPDILATAGHCVIDSKTGAWVTNMTVVPAYDVGVTAPFGTFSIGGAAGHRILWLASTTGWKRDRNPEYDYAAIKLDSPAGNQTGWYGLFKTAGVAPRAGSPIPLTGESAITNGYPYYKWSGGPIEDRLISTLGFPLGSQLISADLIRNAGLRILSYANDTGPAGSGSPVWNARPAGSPACGGGPCAYGIHRGGDASSGPSTSLTANHAVRIDASVFKNLVDWMNGK